MKQKLKIISLFLCTSLLMFSVFAEVIVLKSGRIINERIIERDSETIKIDVVGVPIIYYLDEIESIDGEPITGHQEPSSAIDPYPALPASSLPEKSPSRIFKEVASGVVVIGVQSVAGEKMGSGFIADKEGIIVTNFHVVSGAEKIIVKLKDGRTFPVTDIIDYDSLRDICVLKIDAQNLPVLSLGNSDSLEPGQKVLVIGAPLGLEYTISDGLFSGLRVFDEATKIKSLQFTAPISKGNSGGPLFNMQGQVVGITTRIKPGGQNLNFAVPINEAKGLIHKYPKMSMEEFRRTISKAYEFFYRGDDSFIVGNHNEAINYFQKAIGLKPDMAEAHIFLGVIYVTLENFEGAISILEKAKNYSMDSRYQSFLLAVLGTAYCMSGADNEDVEMFGQGFHLLEKAWTLNPKNEIAAGGIAVALYTGRDFQNASSVYKQCITLWPKSAYYYKQLALCYRALGEIHEARRFLLKAKELIETEACSDTDGGKDLLPDINKALSELSSAY